MGRRQKGTGGVWQRSDGKWVAVRDLGYSLGKRKRKSFVARTRAQAEARLASYQRQLKQGAIEPGQPTHERLNSFLDHWLATLDAAGKPRESTRILYRQIARDYLKPSLGNKRLVDLTVRDVENLIVSLRDARKPADRRNPKSGYRPAHSPRWIQLVVTVLGAALKAAVRSGAVTVNVATIAKDALPQVRIVEPEAITVAEARDLIDAFDEIAEDRGAIGPLLLTLLVGGFRRSEALALRWTDLDLTTGRVTVRRGLHWLYPEKGKGGRWFEEEPKSEKGRREVYLPAFAIERLRSWRARQAETRLGLGADWGRSAPGDGDLVFTDSSGSPLKPWVVTGGLAGALALAGQQHRRVHELRHGFATLQSAEGTTIEELQDVLGHSDIATTRRYLHTGDERRRAAAQRFDRLFGDSKAAGGDG